MSSREEPSHDPRTDTLPVSASATPRADLSEESWVGRVVAGRYVLERVIGRGGMGVVFEAKHVAVGRKVAVKILRPEAARSPEAVGRFHREAKSAAAIGHPRIVEVIDFGYSEEGGAYLVMERLEGSDLSALLRSKGPLPVARAMNIASQVAEALGAAHARGIVHRDLKGGNVFVTTRDGRDAVKVLDFGVSKALEMDDEFPSTVQGSIVGTPHTMAPEQGTDGRSVDHRADLYALGCILFEMLTGELPFTGSTPVEVLYKHVHESPRRPSAVRGGKDIPRALDELVLKLLAKDRERRPADAAAVREALARVDLGGKVRWRRRLAATLLAACAVGAVVVMWPGESVGTREVSGPVEGIAVRDALAEADVSAALADVTAARDAAVVTGPAVLTVVVRPESAVVRVDGVVVTAPEGVLVLRAERGEARVVRVEAPRYVAREERVVMDGDVTLRWTLAAIATEREPVRPASRGDAAVTASADAPVDMRGPGRMMTSPYADGGVTRDR